MFEFVSISIKVLKFSQIVLQLGPYSIILGSIEVTHRLFIDLSENYHRTRVLLALD